GQYRTAAGELVTIYASNSYPVDPALGQRWADLLGSLVHGSEISTVTVLLATPTQIARVCGADAVACYSPQGAVLYTPGEDPGTDLSAEAVITHEYVTTWLRIARTRPGRHSTRARSGGRRRCRYARGREAGRSFRARKIRATTR